MRHVTLAISALALGCGTSAAPTAAAGSGSAGPTGKPAGKPNDQVCCRLGAMKGLSTNKICAVATGTVVPMAECPGMASASVP